MRIVRCEKPGGEAKRLASLGLGAAVAACALSGALFAAQPPNPQPAKVANANLPALAIPAALPGGGLFGPAAGVPLALGAGQNADFDSLIELIEATVAVETWAETGGGIADIRPFPGGVLVDVAGKLRLRAKGDAAIKATRARSAPRMLQRTEADARRASALRCVSLPRLEREIARRQAAGEPLEASMLTLAGLQRVRYVFVYPASQDVVLAGPAGGWGVAAEGRLVSVDHKQPVVRLDDLLTIMRRARDDKSYFGCSINPRQEALARTQAMLAATSTEPLAPNKRRQWLDSLRESVGEQDVEIFGIDPASRVAAVLVEADYHMKLIGMGLEEGVEGVESYLASIDVARDQSPPALSVLRWWFALQYDEVRYSPDRDAYHLRGQGVRVLSENELLAEGERVHTGKSDDLNRAFAEAFTEHFDDLAAKYPVYAELRNIFDLAMAVELIERQGLAGKADWKPALFTDAAQLRLPQGPIPQRVETVVNHRIVNRRHIVAGVSGGVLVAPSDILARSLRVDVRLNDVRRATMRPDDRGAMWWWDAN